MRQFYSRIALAYFLAATIFLMLLAVILLAGALVEVVLAIAELSMTRVLDSVGLAIIGFAVIETAKFIAEEEILRDKELRSSVESRRSLTKFITIIVIAASLEALVMIFIASREDITHAVYPALLFAAAMLALVSLGAYQWLSSRIAPDQRSEVMAAEEGRSSGETEEDG